MLRTFESHSHRELGKKAVGAFVSREATWMRSKQQLKLWRIRLRWLPLLEEHQNQPWIGGSFNKKYLKHTINISPHTSTTKTYDNLATYIIIYTYTYTFHAFQWPEVFHQPGGAGNNTIQAVKAREIFDSRGNPTVEVDLCTETAARLRIGGPQWVWCMSKSKVWMQMSSLIKESIRIYDMQ